MRREIKARYDKLPRKEKELIGSALVKVNMGVALPVDFKIVAGFLKGTGYVAKVAGLDEVIQILHDNEDERSIRRQYEKTAIDLVPPNLSEASLEKGLKNHDEDEEVTVKERKSE